MSVQVTFNSLKPVHYLLPLLAVGVMSFWIHSRLQAPAAPAADLSARETAVPPAPSPQEISPPAPPDPATPALRSKDWKAVAVILERATNSVIPIEREPLFVIEDGLQALTPAELQEAATTMDQIEWGEVSRENLQSQLIREWMNKAPGSALDYYAVQLTKPGFQLRYNSNLMNGLANLARTDLPKATAWLDRQIKAEAFASPTAGTAEHTWKSFESSLLQSAMGVDLNAARRRIEGFTQSERKEILGPFMGLRRPMTPEEMTGYAKLCRKYLDEVEASEVLVRLASRSLSNDGLASISQVMDRMAATPEERQNIATGVLDSAINQIAWRRKVTPEDIAKIRTWLTSQKVEDADYHTGKAITTTARHASTGVDGAFEILRALLKTGSSDALIAGFLDGPQVWNRESDCLDLATTIQNETFRKEVLQETRRYRQNR